MTGFRSIQFKIISVILIILALSVFFSVSFTINNQRANLLDASQQTLAVNTQVLNHTIRNIMLSGEAPLANRTMRDLRQMGEFLEYEIYRRDGAPAFSNYDTLEFVNSYQDEIMFSRTPRQEGDMFSDPGFNEVLKFKTPLVILDEEKKEMEYYFPILNHADCRACHGEDHFIRGISHFRISLSDIYDKVGSARTILTLFFLAVGVVIFFWMLVMLRRIIVRPVFAIGDVVSLVGDGDLDTSISLRQSDEFGELAGRINEMILGLKKSKELELEKTRIEARFEESRKYLDNIREGLLLLNPDYTITNEYSSFLKELFEKEEIAGLSFIDFIFQDTGASEQRRQEMEMFLDFLFNNKTAALSMIMEINPVKDTHLKLASGREIIISADFQRIYGEDGVQNVMVLFQDKTDIVAAREELEAEREMRATELEQIAAILQHGPKVFEDFLFSADAVCELIERNMEKPDEKMLLAETFRETHSLKGTARYLKFRKLETTAHKLEDFFSILKAGGDVEAVSDEITALTKRMKSEIEGVRKIVDRFRRFSSESESGNSELGIFRSRLEEMIIELAGELEKEAGLVFSSEFESIPNLKALQPSIFHLVRNSVDHGIEDPFQRTASGKDGRAEVTLSFRGDGQNLLVIVGDDGRGIDFSVVEKKALEKGILKPGKHTRQEILKAMFASGFSSREESTEISGRGVGLDAVQADVHKLKGRIKVKTQKGAGTSFTIVVPVKELEAAG